MRRYWQVVRSFVHYAGWLLTSAAAFEEGSVYWQGARIHYVVYGEGKPLLLLHGGLSNRLSWFAQLPGLVAAGWRVVLAGGRPCCTRDPC